MRKISSPDYPPTRSIVAQLKLKKIWVPVAILAAFLAWTNVLMMLAMVLVLVHISAIHFAPRVIFTNFCQDVWADDKELLMQFRETQIQLPFDHIEKITWHGSNNPPRAKVTLRTATPYGSVFTFIPDLSGGRQKAKKNIEMLHAKLGR